MDATATSRGLSLSRRRRTCPSLEARAWQGSRCRLIGGEGAATSLRLRRVRRSRSVTTSLAKQQSTKSSHAHQRRLG